MGWTHASSSMFSCLPLSLEAIEFIFCIYSSVSKDVVLALFHLDIFIASAAAAAVHRSIVNMDVNGVVLLCSLLSFR